MSQKQRALGIHKIYFTKNAIRIECQTNGYSICGHAPDWKMFAFRNDDKVYRISTLEDYRRNFPPSYPEVKKARVVKVGEGAKGGLNISVYKVFFSNNSGLYYSMIDKPEVSPKVAEVLLAYYRLCSPVSGLLFRVARGPNGQKLPDLKEWKNDLLTDTQANQPLDIVSTGEVTKVPYRASDFECPKGYKLVAMGNDIFTSKKQKESFSDVFNDMGLGVGFGKK